MRDRSLDDPEKHQSARRAGLAAAILAGVLFTGCEVGPNYKPPQMKVEGGWAELNSQVSTQPSGSATRPATQEIQPSVTTARPVSLTEWWTTFNDPELNSLIVRAVNTNLDLRQAEQRVAEARFQRTIAGARQYPQVNVEGSYEHSHVSKNGIPIPGVGGPTAGAGGTISPSVVRPNAASSGGSSGSGGSLSSLLGIPSDIDLYQVGFDASWELDIFGGQRRGVEAADASYQASIEDRRDVLLSLLAEVAVNYVDLRGAQRQLSIALDNLHTQQQTLKLTVERQKAGVVTELDVDRAASQVAITSARIPQLQNQERQIIHQLGVLLGQNPDSLIEELSKATPTPTGPAEVPVGLPSDLLRRRPDIRRAERQMAAQSAQIGVATADLFPKFSLTGNADLQSLRPEQLFQANSFSAGIGPSVSWPIFDAGRIRANIHLQTAREKESYIVYQRTVLGALKDVEDALVAYSTEQVRRHALADAVEADRKAVNIANQQYHQGVIDFLYVLDAERSLFGSQDALADSDRAVATNLIALYKALGGGWEIETHSK